jgi:hypothetical protein
MDGATMEQPRQSEQPRHRLTAEEVRNKYGTGVILFLAWEIWCIRDGWFHPGYEYIGFSRFMACISFPVLVFCAIMAASALRAIRRRKEQPGQDEMAHPTDAKS